MDVDPVTPTPTPTAARARRSRARREGFTLLEMMVAFAAGAIALTAVYYVGAASAQHFQEQQRVAIAQSALRFGFEQLRRDVARAGYLGAGWSDQVQRCVNSTIPVRAAQIFDNADTAVLPQAAANGVQADRLILTGNYVTGDEYLMVGIGATGGELRLQPSWQSFRRSFLFTDGTFNQPAFEAAFTPGRVLRIRTQAGNHFFATVTGVTASVTDPRVSFSPAMPIGGACTQGLADGATVAPLSRIEYRVLNFATTAAGAQLRGRGILTGADGPQLVRRELTAAGVAIPGTERVIFSHVADFNVDAFFDLRPAGTTLPVIVRRNGGPAQTASTNNAHRIRSLVIRAATRTATEDPRFEAGYQIAPLVPGTARMRRITAEISLPNVVN